jgi:hypothetical protein
MNRHRALALCLGMVFSDDDLSLGGGSPPPRRLHFRQSLDAA